MFGGELYLDDSNCDDRNRTDCTVTLSVLRGALVFYETNEDGLTFACNPDKWLKSYHAHRI